MTTPLLRRITVIACFAVFATVMAVGSAPARAAGAGWVEGNEVGVVNRFCGQDPTTLTPIIQTSTISGLGIYLPDTARNVRVGETFGLHIWSADVADTLNCPDGSVRLALQLPAGVRLQTGVPIMCYRYSSSNPQNVTNFSSVCPQAPQTSNGFLVLNPTNSDQRWRLKPSADRQENLIEIQIPVVADTTGTKFVGGRICDVFAEAEGTACGGTPGANATVSMSFTVDAASGGSQGSAPPAAPTAPSHVEYNVPMQTGSTPLTITTLSYVHAARQGRFRIELDRFTWSHYGDPLYAEESGVFSPGSGYEVEAVYENDADITPWTGYGARTCFVEDAGATACGDWSFVSTSRPTTLPTNPAPTYGPRVDRGWIDTRFVTFSTVLSGARAAGQLFFEFEHNGETTRVEASDFVAAARSGTVSGNHGQELVVGMQFRHRACFLAKMTRPPLVTRGPSANMCTTWRTSTVPA